MSLLTHISIFMDFVQKQVLACDVSEGTFKDQEVEGLAMVYIRVNYTIHILVVYLTRPLRHTRSGRGSQSSVGTGPSKI